MSRQKQVWMGGIMSNDAASKCLQLHVVGLSRHLGTERFRERADCMSSMWKESCIERICNHRQTKSSRLNAIKFAKTTYTPC